MNRSIEIDKKENPRWYFFVLVTSIVFEYIRPQESYLSFLSPLHIPALCVGILTYIFIINEKSYLKYDTAYKLYIAFWLLVSVSVLYAVNTRETYEHSMQLFWMGVGFIFPFAVIINDKDKLLRVWAVWVITHVLLALIVIQKGGTGPGGIVRDENDAAFALVIAFPYLFYYYFTGHSLAKKTVIIISGIVILVAIGLTQSRGGMLGLGAAFASILLMSKRPVKNSAISILIVAIFGGLFVASLPGEYVQDMLNITNPEDSTRDERLYSWSIGWVMFLDNPILGVGAGNFPWMNHLYYELSPMWEPGRRFMGGREAHSVYFTVLPELGLAGVIIFLSIVKISFNRIRMVKQRLSKVKENAEVKKVYLLFNALMASLVSFLVCGAFVSVLFYPFFWYLVCFILVSYHVTNKHYFDEKGDVIERFKK